MDFKQGSFNEVLSWPLLRERSPSGTVAGNSFGWITTTAPEWISKLQEPTTGSVVLRCHRVLSRYPTNHRLMTSSHLWNNMPTQGEKYITCRTLLHQKSKPQFLQCTIEYWGEIFKFITVGFLVWKVFESYRRKILFFFVLALRNPPFNVFYT